MLQSHEAKNYLYSLNEVKYHYDTDEFSRRVNFVCKICSYHGYLSYGEIIEMFENC